VASCVFRLALGPFLEEFRQFIVLFPAQVERDQGIPGGYVTGVMFEDSQVLRRCFVVHFPLFIDLRKFAAGRKRRGEELRHSLVFRGCLAIVAACFVKLRKPVAYDRVVCLETCEFSELFQGRGLFPAQEVDFGKPAAGVAVSRRQLNGFAVFLYGLVKASAAFMAYAAVVVVRSVLEVLVGGSIAGARKPAGADITESGSAAAENAQKIASGSNLFITSHPFTCSASGRNKREAEREETGFLPAATEKETLQKRQQTRCVGNCSAP